jgi:hypothetical protein
MTMTDEELSKAAKASFAKLEAEGRFSKIAAVHDSLEGATTVYEDGTESHGGR